MIYLTWKQLEKVENYFYWQRKLYCEIEITTSDSVKYINRCAMNIGYARAECEAEHVPNRVLSVVKIEGQKCCNRLARFTDIMERFNIGVHPEEKPPRKYFEVATHSALDGGTIGILRCIESGEYAVVTGYKRDEEKYDTIELFTSDITGLEQAMVRLENYRWKSCC